MEEIIRDLKNGTIPSDIVYHKDNNDDICRVGKHNFNMSEFINTSFYIKQPRSEQS